jgi:signal transduction histidine kinase
MRTTDHHLRRLRWSLTAWFSLALAVSLAVLTIVTLRVDSDLRWAAMSESLLARAQQAGASIYFDDERNAVGDRFLADGDLTGGWPQAWVYEVDGEAVLALAGPDEDWYGVDPSEAAQRVVTAGVGYTEWVGATADGVDVFGRGVPVVEPESGTIQAVALALVQRPDFFSDHDTFRTRVLLTAGALTALSAWAGLWLAGKGTAATARALAQQERLLSDAAHELRTPIAAIRAVAEGGLAGDEPPEAALARVARMGDDAGHMVDDMLVLARMDAGRERVGTETLRLDLLAEEVASPHPGVSIESVETVVEGDPGLLRRAISNLVRNAVSHGSAPIKVVVYPSRVVVTDSGPGIPEDMLDRVFERFQTGPNSRGHGLGLPIVRWIAEAHGGTVTARNRPEGGAEVTIIL